MITRFIFTYANVIQTSSESERKKLAAEANKIHEKATGHPMKIDEHGNIETNSEEAKSCPALQ